MALIDFKTCVLELSDESFGQVKTLLEPYCWNYFLESDEITRGILLEKLGEYLCAFEMNAKKRDNDLAFCYTSFLLPYLENRVVENKGGVKNTAQRYLERIRKINDQIITVDSTGKQLSLLEDYTKIFVCLYSEIMKSGGKRIQNVQFHLSGSDIIGILDELSTDHPVDKPLEEATPDALKMFIPVNVLKQADNLRKGINDVQRSVQDAQKGLADEIKNRVTKQDLVVEPVHDFVEKRLKENIYTVIDYVKILLVILYYRVKDYEQGLS